MKVRWIQTGHAIGADRGEVVVTIPVYGGHDYFISCLRSVLACTPADVPILIYDDASPDERSAEFVAKLEAADASEHEVFYLRRQHNAGFPASANDAFAMTAPADVVVLNSDCVVSEGWLEGLRDAAYVDSRVATSTALTNHGSLVSVPERGKPTPHLPPQWNVDGAAAAVRAASLRLRPRLPTAIGHCMYIRRSALELVGNFDLAFTPGYGEEVDFSQRCVRSGLSHVLADDVLVFHHGGGSFSPNGDRDPRQEEHERMIAARYPYYHDSVQLLDEDVVGPLSRALSAARRALTGLSVVVDARILSGPMTGTQLHVLELMAAMARTGNVRITAVLPDRLSGYAVAALRALPDVRQVTREAAMEADFGRADVVHRPYQVDNDEDLSFLARLGERLVVTHQDLISYHNPAYFRNYEAWEGYRRITRSTLVVADRVVFFSEHARDDALSEDLLEPERASVVYIGVDHTTVPQGEAPRAPERGLHLPEGEAILCIGTDFRHKNRLFSLRMLEQLQLRGWKGFLILAGPSVAEGSSVSDEAEFIALRPSLAASVFNVGAVSEAEKAWLFQRSSLVLYPTVHEGFGLVPFEAADRGIPCMWAAGTSLSELLPDDAAGILAWDAEQSADRALALLNDPSERKRNLDAIRNAAGPLTWESTASELIELYRRTCDQAARPASVRARQQGLMQGVLSEDAVRLLGPDGALPAGVERPLLALATHPQLGIPLFGALRLAYLAGHRLRRRSWKNVSPQGEADSGH